MAASTSRTDEPRVDFKPRLERKCSADVTLKDGSTTNAEVQFRALQNGDLEGDLSFPASFLVKFSEISTSKAVGEFEMKGKMTIDGRTQTVHFSKCYLTTFRMSSGPSEISIGSGFRAQEIAFNPEALEQKPSRQLLLGYDIGNVFQTFRVIVETRLGELSLAHYEGIEKLCDLMRIYGTPLMTSAVQLVVRPDGTKTLREVIDDATSTVNGFLRITSLAQGVWHDWASLSVYEKEESREGAELKYLMMKSPKLWEPKERALTNPAHSSIFIKTAYGGYSEDLNEKYGFDRALEWYTEANIGGVLESKFLSATTCLELLMERFHSSTEAEFIIPSLETFNALREALESTARGFMKGAGVDEEQRAAIYRALGGINRRQYVDKAERLLKFWNLRIDDLSATIGDIVNVRNEITHTGTVYSDKYKGKLLPSYLALMMILARLFLAMLHYSGQYYDRAVGDWVNFSDVQTSKPA